MAGLVALHNGDGICFKNKEGVVEGFRVNKVEDNRVFPAEWPAIEPKMQLFRNFDHEFEKELAKESSQRKIFVSAELGETENGFSLKLTDEDNNSVVSYIEQSKEEAKNPQSENQKKQISKFGNTIFELKDFVSLLKGEYFIPSSQLAVLRREAVDLLTEERKKN